MSGFDWGWLLGFAVGALVGHVCYRIGYRHGAGRCTAKHNGGWP